jgi:hypothetical protein
MTFCRAFNQFPGSDRATARPVRPRHHTNEAIDDLALKVGDEALAVIKSSDVMVEK